jgi:hypothetical protein
LQLNPAAVKVAPFASRALDMKARAAPTTRLAFLQETAWARIDPQLRQ